MSDSCETSLTFDKYLDCLNPLSSFEKVTNSNSNTTEYENSYVGVKLLFPPGFRDPKPSGFEEGCLEDRGGCRITVPIKVGSLSIDADLLDEPEFSKACNCDTLTEFRNYYYDFIKGIYGSALASSLGLGNYTWVNDKQTTVRNNYPAQQYEYLTTGKSEGKVSSCDHTIRKHYGILTKIDKIFYRIEHDSCAKPEVYDKFFPEIKKVFGSIEFLPSPVIGSTVTSGNTDNSVIDETSASSSLQILSHNSFTDTLGFLHIVGEVKNNSPSGAKFVEIVSTFYDSNNQVVGIQSTYTNPADIGQGDTAPFEIILTSASIPISEIENYKLAVDYQ